MGKRFPHNTFSTWHSSCLTRGQPLPKYEWKEGGEARLRGRFRASKRLLFRAAVGSLRLLESRLSRRAARSLFSAISDAVYLVDRPAVRRSMSRRSARGSTQVTTSFSRTTWRG